MNIKSPTFRITIPDTARPNNPTPNKASPTKQATKISPSRFNRTKRPPARQKESFKDPRSPKTSPRDKPSTTKHKHKHQHNDDRLKAVMGNPIIPPSIAAATSSGKKRQIIMEYLDTPSTPRLNLAAHCTKTTKTIGSIEDIREKTRMASAMQKLGIDMGKEVMEHWMNHKDYDGVQFGSMSVLYQIKLKELLATIPRTIAKGNYPNKVRTALVLGIFKELSTSKALGKFQPLLESVLSTVVDGIYVPSVRNYADGALLNSTDYTTLPTWFEMARAQSSKISELETKLKAADLLRRRFCADKKMQQALLTRTIDRW